MNAAHSIQRLLLSSSIHSMYVCITSQFKPKSEHSSSLPPVSHSAYDRHPPHPPAPKSSQSLIASGPLFAEVWWGGGISRGDANRLESLELDGLQSVGWRRMRVKLPLSRPVWSQATHSVISSSYQRAGRLFVPTAIRQQGPVCHYAAPPHPSE